MGDTKQTVILAGGDMEIRHYLTLWAAVGEYPDDALVVAETPEEVEGILSESPISKDEFLKVTARLLRHHGEGGLLQFVQLGHGQRGPRMHLGDGSITGEELSQFFADNLASKNPPYVAILMGGCFSGGFARFLQPDVSSFQPDFFYGSSPPFAVSFNGLKFFYEAGMDDADFNGDGVLTIRERAVYDMNKFNPLAVMYSKRGSRDVDLNGEEAKGPYFPKAVETVKTHEDLIPIIDSLRFGEQAVVLIEGSKGSSDDLVNWLHQEALEGDGFYRFLIIKDNEESRRYFETGDGSKILVMGPNLRRGGVEIIPFGHIGDQVPVILANEDPLQVIFDWREKLGSKNYTKLNYLKALGENPNIREEIVKKAGEGLESEDPSVRVDALRLFKTAIVANGVDHEGIYGMLKGVVSRIVSEEQGDMEEMAELAQCLRYLDEKHAEGDLNSVVTAGALRHGEKFLEAAGIRRVSKGAPEFEGDEKGTDEDARVRTLMLLLLHGERAEQDFLEAALTDRESLRLRRGAAYFLKESKAGWEGDIGRLLDIFNAEDDVQVLSYLMLVIGRYKGKDLFEYPWKLAKLEDLAKDDTLPASLRHSARLLSARYKSNFDEYKGMLEKQKAMRRDEAMRWRPRMGLALHGAGRVKEGKWDGGALLGLGAVLTKGVWTDDNAVRRLSVGIQPGTKVGMFFEESSLVIVPTAQALLRWSWREGDDEFSGLELGAGYAGRFELFSPDEGEGTPWRSVYDNGWTASAGYYAADYQLGLGLDFHHFPDAEDYIWGLSFRANFF